MKIAIIGAGPIGVEAAVAAQAVGHQVRVFERGQIADAIRQWGWVRMFSPFGMNSSPRGIARLRQSGAAVPEAADLLTGREYVSGYLDPLAKTLGDSVSTETSVLAIGREGQLKGENIGEPQRGTSPFRLLLREGARTDRERIETADVVLDCTGVFGQPNPLGTGGLPAVGEAAAEQRILRGLPDLELDWREEDDRARFLVVGGGYSAATMICELFRRQAGRAGGRILWAVRRAGALPCPLITDDSLPERDRLARKANALVADGEVELIAGATVAAIERTGGQLNVSLAIGEIQRVVAVHRLLGCCGFRPDQELARELQTQTCWATEGTYPLAAALLGATGGDCLKVPTPGAATLRNPEPGYFALGGKSYGRTPNFLIRTGLQQIDSLLAQLPPAA